MKNERKYLFKRRIKFFFICSTILLGLSAILWVFSYTDDIPLEETNQDSSKDDSNPLKGDIDSGPKEIPKEIPKEVPKEMPKEVPKEMPKETSKEIPKEMPKEISKESPQKTSKETHHPINNSQPSEMPPESPNKETTETTPSPPKKPPILYSLGLQIRNETRSPDGFSRNMYTINHRFPGPEIIVDIGDKFVINVLNELDKQLTTIHVHGLISREASHMDGVPYVTQCPVNGTIFSYEFKATQPGTYWYYSHFETQRADGLFGALVIRDPDEPKLYGYDSEQIVVLSDWYHDDSLTLLKNYQYSNESISSSFEPVPDSVLINGKGIFNCSKYDNDPKKKEKCDTKSLKIEEFHFKSHKYNRFRIINASSMTSFYLSIDGHMLQVIEVDGILTAPSSKFHRLPIYVGQRYSIIPIRLPSHKSISNFYLRAEVMKNFRSSTPNHMLDSIPTEVKAIIRYNNENDTSPPSTLSWTSEQSSTMFSLIDLDPLNLKPYLEGKLPKNTTYYQFDLGIYKFDKKKPMKFTNKGFTDDEIDSEFLYGSINSVQRGPSIYNPDKSTNTLKLILEGEMSSFPFYLNAYVFKKQPTIDFLLNNNDNFDHVFYLHGHKFWVLGRGTNSTLGYPGLNRINPIIRDTVVIPSFGWTLIKVKMDNPGIWTYSNPIVWLQNIGMIGQIIELPHGIKKFSLLPPIRWCILCGDDSYGDVCHKTRSKFNNVIN